MINHLPCKKCGSCLPILKGSVVQCPYCGARNLYMESVYTYKYYLSEMLNISSIKKEKNIKIKEIERRKLILETYFNNFKADFKDYRHLILTKLDTFDVEPVKLFYLIRASGNFEIIIEKYLFPYLENGNLKAKYQELRDQAYIINKSLLGLYYTFLAKKATRFERSYEFYQNAQKNYQNIVDYCNVSSLDPNCNPDNPKRAKFYSILVKFTEIMRNILGENPNVFSEKLEILLQELGEFERSNVHIYNLYKQIESILQLERNIYVLLENIRVDDPFLHTKSPDKGKALTLEEDLNDISRVRDWINDISEKYQKYQKGLLRLHSGRIMKYLSSYRTEIFNFKNRNAEKFDDMLGAMINNALETYNNETIEALEILNDLIQKNIYNEDLIKKFQIGHADLIKMDEVLNNFANNLFTKPLLRNLESEYYKKLISIISGKHTEFDKHILKYIMQMLKNFEDIRNKKVLSLEEQRNQFISEIKPNLQKLIDLSFTLNEEILPYPLFIDVKTQNKKLKIDTPEVITLTIENPNITAIKNIKIYYFMPDTIHNKLNFTRIKKLKANETRRIKTKIIPKEKGFFHSMVMIEYQNINKTFWMPSIKFKLEVEDPKTYKYIPVINREFFETELQATRMLKFLRESI